MSLAFVATVLVPIVIIMVLWKVLFMARLRSVEGGFKHDIILPHTEPVELYFADVSACSMKVRFCLAAAGVQFKENCIRLPSAGSWETKQPSFLKINPAGTVPVLLHNGHPIHESGDQIVYIANNLMPPKSHPLLPKDPSKALVNDYWVEKTSWHSSEIFANLDEGLKKRAGNCIPMMTIPSFPAIISTLSWKNVLHGLLIAGITDKQAFNVIFGFLGVYAFKCLPFLRMIVKKGKAALFQHLLELEAFLLKNGTTFIGGEDVSLGDIGWGAILARMDYVDWWVHVDPDTYPCVLKYWSSMRKHPAYIEATRHVLVDSEHSVHVTKKVREWKKKYSWYSEMFE